MAFPKIPNPLKRAPRNHLTTLDHCPHNHLTESPHPTWRWASGIGWSKWNDKAQAFLFDRKGPSNRSVDWKPSEEVQIKTGKYSYVWCVNCMTQAEVDSIPGSHSEGILNNTHVGLGSHLKQYVSESTLRHLKSYAGRIPTQPGAGRWVLPDNHVDDEWKFGKNDQAPIR